MKANHVNYGVRSEPGVVLKMADDRAYFGHSNINRKVGTRLSSIHAVRSRVAFRRICSGRQLRVQPANAMVVYAPPANVMRCVHKSHLAISQIVDMTTRQPVDLLSITPFTLMAGAISPAGLAQEFCALAIIGYILMCILKRVWAIFYQWWQRTAGFRLLAICHRIIGAWCSWLHPRRCRDYAVIAVLLTTVYPQWPMPIGPFVVYLLNATVGAVVVQAAPLRLRQLWLLLLPRVFLGMIYLQVSGYLPNWILTLDMLSVAQPPEALIGNNLTWDQGSWIGCPKETSPCFKCDSTIPAPTAQTPIGKATRGLSTAFLKDAKAWFPIPLQSLTNT